MSDKRSSLKYEFPEIPQILNRNNYKNKFDCLLYIEEYQSRIALEKFNMFYCKLIEEEKGFSIHVPSLADGKPSLVLENKVVIINEKRYFDRFEGSIVEVITS